MTINISNTVNVTLLQSAALALVDNPNVVVIFTSQQDGPVNSADRYRVYSDAQSVAEDFGTNSATNGFAQAFFGTQPNATNAGGLLVIGYWRGASEAVAATAAKLTGAQLSEATTVAALQQVSDGTLDITIDSTEENLTALDFRSETTLDGIASVIDAALSGGSAAVVDQRIVITSDTTGATSTITLVTDPGSGTFIGETLALSGGGGAVATQGAASDTLAAETKVAAVTALRSEVKYRGFMFIDNPTDEESEALAAWAQANDALSYDVFDASANLSIDPANVVWAIKLAGYTNYRMLYSKAGNRKLAASYMARAHTANFRAENSALTMNLKQLAVAAEDYSQSEFSAAMNVGLDLYAITSKNVPRVFCSGANGFVDERYNLIAFVDFLQTDMFNLLSATGTKIPQTRRGIAQLVDQAEKTTRQFVRAGVFAPGTWSSPDYFGSREVFERNVFDNGFYWLAGSLADQSQASREARESPVIQGAVKLAGAVHSVDIIVNVNR
ncbi:DUF3383 family protein [Marinobacter sp.]|uniref:DUF3383 family protein n=1 Tax=Marinobacter sp. TaxID=50741 RepID=UPI000C95FE81|nr:DUF3383 family protein [Marinobacter sp.]MAB53533.1 hypothetical protein [Marinobacter sp.]